MWIVALLVLQVLYVGIVGYEELWLFDYDAEEQEEELQRHQASKKHNNKCVWNVKYSKYNIWMAVLLFDF